MVFGTSNPDDAVYALDAATGTEVWRFQTAHLGGDEDVGAGPTISAPGANGSADGIVYIDGKDAIQYALDLLTGAEIWSYNMGADVGTNYNAEGVAALVGNDLYQLYGGYVYDFNARTGAVEWRSGTSIGATYTSPAIAGSPGKQVLFAGSLTGQMEAVDITDGDVLWSITEPAAIVTSAAVSDGTLFFGAGSILYEFAPES
jgi:polyvinyl alcohol dehydrogenase (cytochrome)